MRLRITLLCATALLGFQITASAAAPFIAGADFSDLAFFESQGAAYKDGGQVQDALQILKNHGINCIRLRLFTSSAAQAAADPYNHINNTAYTVPLAVRVKNAGLQFSLDFHYSDTWADPGKQATPSAWRNLDFPQLVQQMYLYNSNTIATFAAAGALPDYVQVGNEITPGLLWPQGKLRKNDEASWSRLGQLMKAAIRGIDDASGARRPKIIIHIDRGGDWNATKWFFDNLNAQGVPYDMIGESYYPFFHGSPNSLNNCLSNAAVRFGKPIVVAEDAFPWTNACPASWTNRLFGVPPTVSGQASFVANVGDILKKLPNNLGAGYFYWGSEYQSVNHVHEGGYNTSSFFDFHGNVLPVVDVIGAMAGPRPARSLVQGQPVEPMGN